VIDITQSLMYGSSTKLIQPGADEEGEMGKKRRIPDRCCLEASIAAGGKKSSCGGIRPAFEYVLSSRFFMRKRKIL
jgi:hypothetical protein